MCARPRQAISKTNRNRIRRPNSQFQRATPTPSTSTVIPFIQHHLDFLFKDRWRWKLQQRDRRFRWQFERLNSLLGTLVFEGCREYRKWVIEKLTSRRSIGARTAIDNPQDCFGDIRTVLKSAQFHLTLIFPFVDDVWRVMYKQYEGGEITRTTNRQRYSPCYFP